MVKIKAVPYIFKIRRKGSKKDNLLNLKELDIESHFKNFMKSKNNLIDSTREVIFSLGNLNEDKGNNLYYGSFLIGDYGYSSDIFDIQSTKKVLDKTPEQAERIKFYYVVGFEKNYFIILLNQFKNKGVKTIFFQKFKEYLIQNNVINNDELTISLNPIYSEEFYNVTDLFKIRLITHRKKQDVEGNILKNILEEDFEEFTEEKILKPNKKIKNFKDFIFSLRNDKKNRYIEVDNIIYDNLKIEIRTNDGGLKTLSLERNFELQESFFLEFKEDLPDPKKYYSKVKDYFLRVAKNSSLEE